MKIPFSPPFVDDEVRNQVLETLDSGWITSGPKVLALEKGFVEFTNCKEAVAFNSWTSACILVLKWFGVKEGDEVIVPAYTYAATALAVLQTGATPVMVDVCEDFTIDVKELEKKISERTKAVIPVDIGGWLANYSRIEEVVHKHIGLFQPSSLNQSKLGRILVISDAAHSFGAKMGNSFSGQEADIVIYSLHAVKNLTTAEGGVVCLNLPDSFDNHSEKLNMKRLGLNGQTKDAFTKSQAGGWRYDIVEIGFKFNMPDICAAIGVAQLKSYESLLEKRKAVFNSYKEQFLHFDWAIIPPQINDKQESSYHLFQLRMKGCNENQRDLIIDKMAERGVATNVHFIPLPMLTAFKELGYSISDFPKAVGLFSNEISLPIYPQLEEVQVKYIIDNLIEVYNDIVG